MKKPALTQERQQDILQYDPDTGAFRWRVQKKSTRHAGDIAGYQQALIDFRTASAAHRPRQSLSVWPDSLPPRHEAACSRI